MVDGVGSLAETRDGGRSWTPRASGLAPGASLQFVNDKVGFALFADNGLRKTTDGGSTWTAASNGMLQTPQIHAFFDAQLGVARGGSGRLPDGQPTSGTVWATRDGGLHWSALSAAPRFLNALLFVDATRWIGVGGNGIAQTEDGGASWKPLYPGDSELLAVARSETGIYWAAGRGGKLLRTVDAGVTWTAVALGGRTEDITAIKFADPKHGWLVGRGSTTGSDGLVMATRDAGLTWTVQPSGVTGNSSLADTLDAIDAIDARTAWIRGPYGGLLTTATGGY